MKKIKKLIVALLAMTMVIGCLAVQASAAEGDYIVLGTDVGSTWDFGTAAVMTDEGNGVYKYTFNTTADTVLQFKVAKKSLVTASGDWDQVISDKGGGNFTYVATGNEVVITYNANITDRAGVSVSGATNSNAITSSTFNFMGDEGLTGVDWNNGPDKEAANAMTLAGGNYSITFEDVNAGTYTYKILENQSELGWNSVYVYGDKNADGNGTITVPANGSTVKVSVNATTKGVTVDITEGSPVSASECIDAINAIGTVELTAGSKAKIEAARTKVNSYAGNASDITNLDKLTAAEAKWEELVAAAPGKLTLHVKHEWDAVAGYVFGSNEDAGSWPGTVGLANVSNTGWDDITITLSAANTLILNDNKKNDGEQTANIEFMSQGEYWVTIAADKSYTITKTAPEGWVLTSDADAAANVETRIDAALALDATKANKGKYDEALSAYKALTDAQKKLVDAEKVTALNAGVKTIEDIIAKEQAEEDAKNAGTLTVYVKSPSWESMSVYGWDGAEFGEWPGKKLTALKVNEGWFSVSFDITKATNLIFNDGKAEAAEQTVDWKEVKAGTYWLVLSEKDDKGKYLVDALSTKAPEGWKEEAAEKIEQELPSNISTVTQEEINAMKDSIKVEGTTDKLVVSPLEAVSKDVAVITTALSKELKGVKFVAVDLKFESGKQPTTGTKITIDVTKMADVKAAKYVAVYSVKDAKMELVDTVEVKDGKITFAPKHFSTYVFAEAADPTANPDGGVVNTAVIVSAVVMLAAATVIVASKKRVTE